MESLDLSMDLQQLISQILALVDNAISDNAITPSQQIFFRWTIGDYSYTEHGSTYASANGNYFARNDWTGTIYTISDKVLEDETARHICVTYGIDSADLGFLVRHVLYLKLNDKQFDVKQTVNIFISDLKKEPQRCGAVVELKGITLESSRINLSTSDVTASIRQVTLDDLEEEQDVTFRTNPHVKNIHSILEISYISDTNHRIQQYVNKFISIFRLFKVGAVEYIKFSMFSDCIINRGWGGTIGTSFNFGSKKYYISKAEEDRLFTFFHSIDQYIPYGFYENDTLGFLEIAFKRYCDALLEKGIFESKIANSVMGLEALYLKDSENSELVYRLRVRIAKVVSFFDSPNNVKQIINDAYKIRSQYVHGSQLSDNERDKYTRKYSNDIDNLLYSVLEVLRVSIVCFIFLKLRKEDLIDMIDDSFFDQGQNASLGDILKQGMELIKH